MSLCGVLSLAMPKSPFSRVALLLAYTAAVVFITWYFVAPKATTHTPAAAQSERRLQEMAELPAWVKQTHSAPRPREPDTARDTSKDLVVGDGQRYANLQEAINDAPDGSTIIIMPGEYHSENVIDILRKSNLTIRGQGHVEILTNNMQSDVIHVESSNNIVFDNLTVRHTDPPKDTKCSGNVFSLWNSDDVTIKNSDINGSGVVGIMSYDQDGLTLENNTFHRNQYAGVELFHSRGISRLKNNTFDNNGTHVDVNGKKINEDTNKSNLEMSGNRFLSPPNGVP